MGIEAAFNGLQDWLTEWPDTALTLVLAVLALVLIVIALRGTAMEKAIVAAWVMFP
jgi:hypothetical protein